MTTTIASRLQAVHARIANVAQSLGRKPDEITLLAASKTNPAENLREAWVAGQRIFGENYLQEALAKMQHLTDLPIEWTSSVRYKAIRPGALQRISPGFTVWTERRSPIAYRKTGPNHSRRCKSVYK